MKNDNPRIRAAGGMLCALLAFQTAMASAAATLPNVFSDHAVLQRDAPVPVWGRAEPGEKVTVRFAGQSHAATADAKGDWRVVLDPMPASAEPRELTVHTAASKDKPAAAVRDVVVGEVWVCAGQSNMGTTMAGTPWWMAHVPSASHPQIRLLALGGNGGLPMAAPQKDVPDVWHPCTPASAFSFSAIGYFFGTRLHAELGVPVGMIKASSWGVPAEQYVSVDALRTSDRHRARLERLDADVAAFESAQPARDAAEAGKRQAFETAMAAFERTVREQDAGLRESWPSGEGDRAAWTTVRMPGRVEAPELRDAGGVVWLRKETTVLPSWAGRELRLHLGGFGDAAATVFFNGREIGRSGDTTHLEGFPITASEAVAGKAVVAVRLVNDRATPFQIGGPEFLLYLAPADGGHDDERMPLPGDWERRVGCVVPRDALPPSSPSPAVSPAARGAPGCLYNGMIAPLVGYGIGGVLWYQGENDAKEHEAYTDLFPLLIRSWREAWQSEFAFLWVQLPNYVANGKPRDVATPPTDAKPADYPLGWAPMREVQLKTLSLPNTAMAVTIDCGESWDIHPANKRLVAERLLKAALGRVYKRDVVGSGPVFESLTVEKDAIRLRFSQIGGGLVARGGPLRSFAIAGDDRVFHWAEATIDGDTVVVRSPKVPKPAAVRYAFSGDPPRPNLYNAEGLPASPFRTDDWELGVD